MPIASVQFEPSQPTPPRGRPAVDRGTRSAAPSTPTTMRDAFAPNPAAQSDPVQSLRFQNMLVERILSRVQLETGLPPQQAGPQSAGLQGLVAGLVQGQTPDSLAARMAGGITGPIFRAWAARFPGGLALRDIMAFREQVLRGLELGVADAKDILTGLRALNPLIVEDIERTVRSVRERLERFFQQRRQLPNSSHP